MKYSFAEQRCEIFQSLLSCLALLLLNYMVLGGCLFIFLVSAVYCHLPQGHVDISCSCQLTYPLTFHSSQGERLDTGRKQSGSWELAVLGKSSTGTFWQHTGRYECGTCEISEKNH